MTYEIHGPNVLALEGIKWDAYSKAISSLMSNLSETYYAAAWLIDTEYIIWDYIYNDKKDSWGISDDDVLGIKILAEEGKCWVLWRGTGLVAVNIDAWREALEADRNIAQEN